MGAARTCANCGSALPADQPVDQAYCARCAAAWTGAAPVEPNRSDADGRRCANCGTALPEDQPSGHDYCATCAAAWQRGGGARA
jgi:hypothetical protein